MSLEMSREELIEKVHELTQIIDDRQMLRPVSASLVVQTVSEAIMDTKNISFAQLFVLLRKVPRIKLTIINGNVTSFVAMPDT